MLTGLEINLQIALIALGLTTVAGIYLYSRFRDRNIIPSKAEPSVNDEYGGEPEHSQDFPDYLADIDSAAANSEPEVSNPQQETGHVHSDECRHAANSGSDTAQHPEPTSIHDTEADTNDNDEPEALVLVEQVDLQEMVGSMEEEMPAQPLDNAHHPGISDSSAPRTGEAEPEIPHDLPVLGRYDEAEESNEPVAGSANPEDEEIHLPSRQQDRKPKFKGLGIFNPFRSTADSGSDLRPGNEPKFDFENSDVPDQPDDGTTRVIGEYGEIETSHGGLHDNLEEITRPRFQYPEITGFNRLGQIDYWVKFHGGGYLAKKDIQTRYLQLFHTLHNPAQLYGTRDRDQKWVNVVDEPDSTLFDQLIVSLQLVDPAGPVSRKELNRFTDLITRFSESSGKDITFMAPLESAMQQANALSECVRLYDSPCMVLVVPERDDSYMHGHDIENCVNMVGLEAYKTNYYVRTKVVKKKKMLLYGVANMSDEGTFDFENMQNLRLSGLVFFFRPLFHKAPGSVLNEMVSTAKSFAMRIGAKAVTTNGEELTVAMTADIRAKIEKRTREMAVCGLKSGGDTILRIFESEIFVSD